MGRKPSPTLTDAELRIMRVLWKHGECKNVDIVAAITNPPLARNTVMTTLGVLERKGYVNHRTEGRTFYYYAVIPEEAVRRNVLESVLNRFFNGSVEQLVVKLLDTELISTADRTRIQKILDEAEDE